MTTETLNSEVAHIIEVITTQLDIAVEQIFGVFVGAQPIIGILSLATIVVVFATAYLTWKVFRKASISWLTDDDGDWENDDSAIAAIFIPIVVTIVSFLLTLAIVDAIVAPAILKIMCPEYSAMKEIISIVKP